MTKRRSARTNKTSTVSRRSGGTMRRKRKGRTVNFWVPLFFIACMVFCIGFLIFVGYQNATTSAFFKIKDIETVGITRASEKKIRQIVRAGAFKTGVWNADLEKMKNEIEALNFVKHASVSKVLPNGFRVVIREREPRAVARIGDKDFLIDDDASVLVAVSEDASGQLPPFVLLGWDEDSTSRAREMNRQRVELYSTLIREWQQFDLISRVKAVDLSDLNDPQVMVTDSGETVTISLGKGDFAAGLQKGLETIAGKGAKIKYVIDPNRDNPIIGYRNS